MDSIFIEKLRVDAIIGVYPNERQIKQPLIIDVDMSYDARQAIASDTLKYALDYHKVCKDIHGFVSQSSYQLIETLADAIAQKILKIKGVVQVIIKVSKPNALDLADNVGVRIQREN
ncbi:MAG: dihydroneopterin aldolase [Proteobacteria bacterium]|nr:dihydroneopterin aldolase [Pseudomonadota bacterium]